MSEDFIELPLVASTDPLATMTVMDDETQIRRSVLPGGATVLTQTIPAQRSVSLSAWCPVGSRHEPEQYAGATHFLEHLLFKGTRSRSAQQIANAFDAVGGESNAGTTKEFTYYWARVLQEDLPMAVSVLGDMVTSSVIDPEEFERERTVIHDEIAMGNDDGGSVVHENFARAVFGASPLGRPIGGTVESVNAASRQDVWQYYQERYASESIVFVAAGAVEHDQLCALVNAALQDGGWSTDPQRVPTRPTGMDTHIDYQARELVRRKEGEQAHVIVGGRGLACNDDRRSVMSVLLAILGGSMSSRLFQEVREKRGLAYSTYAFDSSYVDAGLFGLYAGCAPGNVEAVEDLMRSQLEDLAAAGPTEEEMVRVQGQLRGALALGLEDSSARMVRLGRAELVHGRFRPVDRVLRRLQEVQPEQVSELAQYLLEQPWCRSRVLPPQ
ncbi:pitrilysin family protein [Gleimia hominis]|uniref:Pitrilysin family protein n=1 Tax=Gleimia hominis TaxID=595468 RepID=A0ABU3IC53_9ACTO|nr:pitrilysin family protein [Gleimia hominis]MDT3767511.1 pitrilysin family protein [Gleimia hominis]